MDYGEENETNREQRQSAEENLIDEQNPTLKIR
jgi:hypothetical protein